MEGIDRKENKRVSESIGRYRERDVPMWGRRQREQSERESKAVELGLTQCAHWGCPQRHTHSAIFKNFVLLLGF